MAKRIRNRNPRFNRLPLPPAEKIETPLNHLGLVDAQATVEALRSSVDHNWVEYSDTHHLYWPANRYPKKQIERQFRELPIHKIMLPRDFHDYLHITTEPPPIPDKELMYYQVLSYEAVKSMFDAARLVIQKQREKDRLLGRLPTGNVHGGISSRQKAISTNKKQFEQALEVFDSVPPEGRIVSIDTNENLGKIAQSLAVVALKPKQSYAPVLLAA